MKIYVAQTTGSLQLPIFSSDPPVTASGNIWYNNQNTGSIKYSIVSASVVITRTLLAV